MIKIFATLKLITCKHSKIRYTFATEFKKKIPAATFVQCLLQHSSIAKRRNIATSKNYNCSITIYHEVSIATSKKLYCNITRYLLQHDHMWDLPHLHPAASRATGELRP